jgi:hypothetical protein
MDDRLTVGAKLTLANEAQRKICMARAYLPGVPDRSEELLIEASAKVSELCKLLILGES